MGTGISWTDRTWNPVAGCTRVSPGCDHCYAFQLHDQRHIAWKRGRWPKAPAQYHRPFSDVQLLPDRLGDPLHWRRPSRVFVNSMSDLFHPSVPDLFILEVWITMAMAQEHTFQVLTKRPERMRELLGHNFLPAMKDRGVFAPKFWPLPNVWVGTSVEDQTHAYQRLPALLDTPAAVHFVSAEPLLGRLDLLSMTIRTCDDCGGWRSPFDECCTPGASRIDWVIAGGESGAGARPCDLDWLRDLRDQTKIAGAAFHLKQLGGRKPGGTALLDGREWKEFPDGER